MSIKTFFRDLFFGIDTLELIKRRQNDIVAIQAKAQDKVCFATLDIEDAVDLELDNIRQTVAAAVCRIEGILKTNAVHGPAAKVLAQAQTDINVILDRVDDAI